jgi:hypothetical protein
MSRIIEHKDLVIWRDARGKWQCRSTAAPTGAVYRSGARSSGTEAIRSRLWGRGRRRRDVDEPPITVGNCGRPADKECGMLNPQECATHRQEDIDGRRLHMRIVRASDRLNAPIRMPTDTKAQQLLYLQRLRERHGLKRGDPRIVAADCAFRFRVW